MSNALPPLTELKKQTDDLQKIKDGFLMFHHLQSGQQSTTSPDVQIWINRQEEILQLLDEYLQLNRLIIANQRGNTSS